MAFVGVRGPEPGAYTDRMMAFVGANERKGGGGGADDGECWGAKARAHVDPVQMMANVGAHGTEPRAHTDQMMGANQMMVNIGRREPGSRGLRNCWKLLGIRLDLGER